MGVEIRPQVWEDVAAAALEYQDAREGLGEAFVDEIQVVLRRIEENPRQFPRIYKRVRVHRALLTRFPYGVYFQMRRDRVEVIAVTHLSRSPRHWRRGAC